MLMICDEGIFENKVIECYFFILGGFKMMIIYMNYCLRILI